MQCAFSKLVVIGGSAGSLNAIEHLVSHIPVDSGMAYIIVQHLSREHQSQLSFLISRWTKLEVITVTPELPIAINANTIYVASPKYAFINDEGKISCVEGLETHFKYRPIDYLSRSVAHRFGEKAVLVILSGTGHDGTEGARQIKAANGAVICQLPESACYPSMPQSLVENGLADKVAEPEKIPAVLGEMNIQSDISTPANQTNTDEKEMLKCILKRVAEHTGKDLHEYKESTLLRRVKRRMALRKVLGIENYLQVIIDDSDELERLAKDLFIGVTSFFRDQEAFDLLQREIIPRVVDALAHNSSVRCWVAGCSTGEEAYSIAISFFEYFRAHNLTPELQIFATDIEEESLQVARNGLYPQEVLNGLSDDKINNYFEAENNRYRIRKEIREKIVFASHNLISDPPFLKLDLVVCRNLLIYLNRPTQNKLLGLFHFALNDNGFLFLGSSESIGSVERHFTPISKKWRFFQHTNKAPRRTPKLPLTSSKSRMSNASSRLSIDGEMISRERMFQNILANFGNTQVLIDCDNHILYTYGTTSQYLSIPPGEASHEILKIVHPEFLPPLQSAINLARQKEMPVAFSLVRNDVNETPSAVRIEVSPLPKEVGEARMIIEFSITTAEEKTLPLTISGGEHWLLQQMTHELEITKQDLQRTVDQSRVSNEEMRAANEEIMAMNEELQSANEELESSKEELQSLNEELSTSNTNLDAKIVEIEGLNSDLNNLLFSSEASTLLLDKTLNIRRYSPAMRTIMKLIESDIGRNIEDLVRLVDDADLTQDCNLVLASKSVRVAKTVQDKSGHWFYRRVTPYKNSSSLVEGVVVNYIDITPIKEAERLISDRTDKLEWQANLLANAAPIFARDLNNRIIFWNLGAQRLYGWTEQEAIGKVSHDLLKTESSNAFDKLTQELKSKGSCRGELVHWNKSGEKLLIDSRWTAYQDSTNKVVAFIEVNTDITGQKKAQKKLAQQETTFKTMMDWTYNWEYWLAPNGNIIYMTPSSERITGYTPDEFKQNPALLKLIVHEKDIDIWQNHQKQNLPADQDVCSFDLRIQRKNSEVRWVNHSCRSIYDADHQYLGRRVSVVDITQKKYADEQIKELANFDPLTHLPNRRLLHDRIGQAFLSSERNSEYCALLLIDLDLFKKINDTEGHDIGDKLLIETANRLTKTVRQHDTVARFGGDEFIIILNDIGKTERQAATCADELSEKVKSVLTQPYILHDEGQGFYNTASIGVTLFIGNESSVEVLIKQADLALYQAKDAGRNAIRFFNPNMQAVIEKHLALETALRKAIHEDQLRLFYQPIVNPSCQIVGAEALIRWQLDNEVIPPDKFIPIAEESALIVDIGNWVIKTACKQLKTWESDDRTKSIKLSVNVSARQLRQPNFADNLLGIVKEAKIDTSLLKLELTESAVLHSLDHSLTQMVKIRESGITFSLDDFGTGYSSLFYLKTLPISELKIDRTFIRDIPEDSNDSAIVKAILAMSKTLDISVISEGVETEAQRNFLLEFGGELFQGYLFSKPLPIEAWDDIL